MPLESVPWESDLIVYRGGPSASEVLLLRAENPKDLGPLLRLAARWTSEGRDKQRAHVAFALSEVASEGVLTYFRHAPGEKVSHDNYMRRIEAVLPLDRCALTVVSIAETGQDQAIELSSDPPNHGGELIGKCLHRFRRHSFSCIEPELDRDWMFASVQYATGETGLEQVLDWDDMYTNEHWRFLEASDRLFLSITDTPEIFEGPRLGLLAGIVAEIRRERAS